MGELAVQACWRHAAKGAQICHFREDQQHSFVTTATTATTATKGFSLPLLCICEQTTTTRGSLRRNDPLRRPTLILGPNTTSRGRGPTKLGVACCPDNSHSVLILG